jgi:hypothetical protein
VSYRQSLPGIVWGRLRSVIVRQFNLGCVMERLLNVNLARAAAAYLWRL